MLIPAKALTYGGPRSRIQVQLPNGKILSAIAATPINSPNVAIGFDQQGQAWVWGEVSKIALQSTSIRKNRSFNQEIIYPFKVVARWSSGGYIAQAGDRSSQQVEAQQILAFGNRGKAKSDFILLTETGTNQYRLKNKEGERSLNFDSDLLETFQLNGKFYGDDYYGILLRDEQLWKNSDIITTTTGTTLRRYTPDGAYEFLQVISDDEEGWNPPRSSFGNVAPGGSYQPPSGFKIVHKEYFPNNVYETGYSIDQVTYDNWWTDVMNCMNSKVDSPAPVPDYYNPGGQSVLNDNRSVVANTQQKRRILSGFLDSISKNTAVQTINAENIDTADGVQTWTASLALIEPTAGTADYCRGTIPFNFGVSVIGGYWEAIRPYYVIYDKIYGSSVAIADDSSNNSYDNSIPIVINSFNTIDCTINQVSNTSYIYEFTENIDSDESPNPPADYTPWEWITETEDNRESINESTNKVTGLYKGADELCLYSKTDDIIDNASAVKTTYRRDAASLGTLGSPETTTINGQVERNNDIIKRDIYLANRENNLALARDYFYIRVTNIKNKINLSDLATPFTFNVNIADILETIGRLPLYFNYPIKYAVQNVTRKIFSSPPQNTIISNSATLLNSYSDEYYLDPDISHPIELIVFDNDDIYKLSGTASINYQNTAKTFNASHPSFPGNYGQFSYSEASLSTISVTIQSYQLIKYHALKGVSSNAVGHLYSSTNCLGLLQKILGADFTLQSGITRTTLYKRKNGQIMMAFSDKTNLTQKKDRYADLYRLENNKFTREGEKKGAYYPVINPNSSTNPNTSFIGYYD